MIENVIDIFDKAVRLASKICGLTILLGISTVIIYLVIGLFIYGPCWGN